MTHWDPVSALERLDLLASSRLDPNSSAKDFAGKDSSRDAAKPDSRCPCCGGGRGEGPRGQDTDPAGQLSISIDPRPLMQSD